MQISKKTKIAIIGASNNPEKYGYKVYKDLKENGFNVIPINIHEQEIQGDKAYNYLKDYPEEIDVIVLVIPPEQGLIVLSQALAMQIKKVWFQPGSESEDLINFAKEHGFEYVANACIMVERKARNKQKSFEFIN